MNKVYVIYRYWDGSEQYGAVIEGVANTLEAVNRIIGRVEHDCEKAHQDGYAHMKKYFPNLKSYEPLKWKTYKDETDGTWGVQSFETNIEVKECVIEND